MLPASLTLRLGNPLTKRALFNFGLVENHMLANHGIVFAERKFFRVLAGVFLGHIIKARIGRTNELNQYDILLCHGNIPSAFMLEGATLAITRPLSSLNFLGNSP
jgi:hypothetical protein